MFIQYIRVEELHYAQMPELRQMGITVGGACATVTSPEGVPGWDAFRAVFPKIQALTPTIFLFEDAMMSLTAEEQEAVRLHEEGHLALGHITVEMTVIACAGGATEPQLIDVLANELAADAYAADRIGREVTLRAFTKAFIMAFRNAGGDSSLSERETIARIREHSEEARRRLDALCSA